MSGVGRWSLRSAVALVAVVSCQGAHALDHVAMPFACSVANGRLAVVPGPEQRYAIVGGRDEQQYTACSPSSPDRCRSWIVHRFTLACTGGRVRWIDVVGQLLDRRNTRGFVDGGRLHLPLSGRPMARAPALCPPRLVADTERQLGARPAYVGRECLSRELPARLTHVGMPSGFAPLGVMGARLVGSPPPPLQSQPPGPPQVAQAVPAGAAVRVDVHPAQPQHPQVGAHPASPLPRPADTPPSDPNLPWARKPAAGASAVKSPGSIVLPPSPQLPTRAPSIAPPDGAGVASGEGARAEKPAGQPPAAAPSAAAATPPAPPGPAEPATPASGAGPAVPPATPVLALPGGTPAVEPGLARWSVVIERVDAAPVAAPPPPPAPAASAPARPAPSSPWRDWLPQVPPAWPPSWPELRTLMSWPVPEPPTRTLAAIAAVLAASLAALVALMARRRPTLPPLTIGVLREQAGSALAVRPADGPVAVADAQMCTHMCRTAEGMFQQIADGLEQIQGAPALRHVLLREAQAIEQRLAAMLSTPPEDADHWRRLRNRLQRILQDLNRLKDIADGAARSLSSERMSSAAPRDRHEALALLGVNEGVDERILKKLVDALRQCWHPDLATSDADRRQREERIKQINVAADLAFARPAKA